MSKPRYDVNEKPSPGTWMALSFQHVFAMFGATILVPILTKMDVASALLASGVGTLIFIALTKGKVPAYMGSSFSFIAAIGGTLAAFGPGYVAGGAITVAGVYLLTAAVIFFFGNKWVDRVFPPVVMGSVIMVIGLSLAGVAMSMATQGGTNAFNAWSILIAAVTLGAGIVYSLVFKNFLSVIPILLAVITGYVFTVLLQGLLPGQIAFINFAAINFGQWINLPHLVVPQFDPVVVITFALVSLATITEHLGHIMVTGKVINKDLFADPGLHRTLSGDGLATGVAGLLGGPCATTYGENISVLAITRVYSVWVIAGAAVLAILLSFFSPLGQAIGTIPVPVIGGVSIILFGIIANQGIRTMIDRQVDFSNNRNLILGAIILVIGTGAGSIEFVLSGGLKVTLGGVALATLAGIVLNLILPQQKKA